MRGFLKVMLLAFLAGLVRAEEVVVDLPVRTVELDFSDASWFVDSPSTAVVTFPELVETPAGLSDGGDGIRLISCEVLEAESGEGSVAVIQWLPEREGLTMFPVLEFLSERTRYRSSAKPIRVDVPRRSSRTELAITPEKVVIYAGEPLRLDVEWNCQVPSKRLRSMDCNPPFFNDSGIEVVVPRSVLPEKERMGMPFGGRRIIARREVPADGEGLGVVSFPLFLRFSEPGNHTLPAVRIECALLKRDGGAFAPYAAYFNNGLFESVSEGEAYERIFVESEPIRIEVLPLPQEGRLESFSGLFAPCSIEVSAKPTETEVGQLMELDLLVRSEAPHGFLELPELTKQRALRSWFKVDSEYGRAWHPDGTVFRTRVRPLTTKVKVLPALEFEIFDPQRKEYVVLVTEAIPLRVLPRDGHDYFDSKTLDDGGPSLTDTSDGIWQNAEIHTMDEILNELGNFLVNYFWFLLAAGPVMFALLLPLVRERRRLALSPGDRLRKRAYQAFRRLPEGGDRKWQAFREYVATGLGVEVAAWTSGDARRQLAERGVGEDDIELVVKLQESLDAHDYSAERPRSLVPKLNSVAKRIGKALGQSVPMVLAVILSGSALGGSVDWTRAQETFDRGLAEGAGSDQAVSLFTESALLFEACAQDDQYVGKSWLNAGNAWFQAGEIGRSIAAYRQAEVYRPFDQTVRDNLTAARALAVDVVDDRRSGWYSRWPTRWIAAVLIPVSFGFWIACLGWVRFRSRVWSVAAGLLLIAALGLGSLRLLAKHESGKAGVVVVPEVFGRKGPSYHYQTAFNEALHDGLEVRIVERRDDWLQVELADERRAWVPVTQVQSIFR